MNDQCKPYWRTILTTCGNPGQGMFKLQGEKGNQQQALETTDDLKIAMILGIIS